MDAIWRQISFLLVSCVLFDLAIKAHHLRLRIHPVAYFIQEMVAFVP